MIYRIEIHPKAGVFDAVASGLSAGIVELGIKTVFSLKCIPIFLIKGKLSDREIKNICQEVLTDPVTQDFKYYLSLTGEPIKASQTHDFEIAYNLGVMDPVEESTLKAIKDLGIDNVETVRTAKRYIISGALSNQDLKTIQEKLLYNKVIQHIVENPATSYPSQFRQTLKYKLDIKYIDILDASDRRLEELSRRGQLFLKNNEMRFIADYFAKQKRNPTDCELETIAQTWSEHCGHKTFKGAIDYSEEFSLNSKRIKRKKIINNLLKSTIMKVTKKLNKPWCVSVFEDNSGIINFDKDYNVCFKVETHNHPSAIEPFGGANTGIGGVIRDCLGSGLGARPVLNTDVFCFAPPDYEFSKLPIGVLHPKRIMKGVVSGVRDYGNKMGIPTVNGAIIFDNDFLGNPLVFCGTAGIIPKNKSKKKAKKTDLIVLVGGRTGRDGIHGATFSSGELTDSSESVSSSAVQIGNPIEEKKMLEAIIKARDKNLYNAITDCGGGGLSSAVGEMGKDLGVRVDLEKVPLKYQGISYTEIWISEAQERMILSVPKKNLKKLKEIFDQEDVELSVIGEFMQTGRLKLYYNAQLVCDLDMNFLHQGGPKITKKAIWKSAKYSEPNFSCPSDLTDPLKRALSDLNICSKEWVIRQYDHEVQGGSVIKPLEGILNDGPSDAAVVRPKLSSRRGIAVSCGINPRYSLIDPYWMAASCIDEAARQIISVGGSLKTTALLDNFCWGNPEKIDRLGSLVRACFGCLDSALAYKLPFISGKDSLNNEYKMAGESISIPGTLLISAISVIEDTNKCPTMFAKSAGNLIYILGLTSDELGGSVYFKLHNLLGNSVPKVYPQDGLITMQCLEKAILNNLVASCHDCSEGGLVVALAEMAFSGSLGMDIFLKEVPYKNQKSKIKNQNFRNDYILFSESNSRFIVEVPKLKQKKFEKLMKNVNFGLIGCLNNSKDFNVYGLDGELCIQAPIDELKQPWQAPLRW
ncbi:MAG: phosphoribosylformylglycinamidine synthase subunit PurL [Candidatus Omnitrophota bacterium]